MTNMFFGSRNNSTCDATEPYSKRLNLHLLRDSARANSLTTSAEVDLDLFTKTQSKFLSRLLTSRQRPSRSFDDPSTATTTTTVTASGLFEGRLPFRRPALRITKVSPGDIGRRCRRALRRIALFLLTAFFFSLAMNILLCSVKWFFHLPHNITVGNVTLESEEVVDSPALLAYLVTSSLIIFIPLSLIATICFDRKVDSLSGIFTIYVIELTEGHATWSVLILRSFVLNTLWTVFLYCVMRALRLLSVADMTMLLGILPPYSYLFTWILVPKKFVAFRIIALILASCGMIFLTHLDRKNTGSKIIAIFGIVLMGLFTTVRRNLIGDLSISKIMGFYGFLGLTHAILTWPLFVLLSVLTSAEPITWKHFPWLPLIVVIVSKLGMLILHEVAQIVNGTALFRLLILAVFPVAVAQEIFWRGDLSYFDNVRIASSVLILAGGLITALPTRLYENIEDWIQRRRSPLDVYHSSNMNSTGASGAMSGGPGSSNQVMKAAGPLTSNINLSPVNENALKLPTLAIPMRRRSLLRSNSISINRGR